MVEALRAHPHSAASLAKVLDMPRQTVNYHLKELERAGLIEFAEHRARRNMTERVLRAKARSYVISPAALGALGLDPETAQDRFSAAYLVDAAARALRDVTGLAALAEAAGKRLATLTLETDIRFQSAEDRARFAEEFTAEVARLVRKYHSPHGRTFRLLAASFPQTTHEEPNA